jgi:hypothetical protein
MENYYFKKYNKYKFKYLKLKKQVAGSGKLAASSVTMEVVSINEQEKYKFKESIKEGIDLKDILEQFEEKKKKIEAEPIKRNSKKAKEKREEQLKEVAKETLEEIFTKRTNYLKHQIDEMIKALQIDGSQNPSYSGNLEKIINTDIFNNLFESISGDNKNIFTNIKRILSLIWRVSNEKDKHFQREDLEYRTSSKEQMKKFWGNRLVDGLCNKDDRLKYNCFLCSGAITKHHKIEMEHKIDTKNAHLIFHPLKLELIKLELIKSNEPGTPSKNDDKMDNYMTQWIEFANADENYSKLLDLYMLINSKTDNSNTCMKNVNDRMNDLSENFKKYLVEKFFNIVENDFSLAFSVIKFWLVEYAYAHETCNGEKSDKTFYNNDEVDMGELNEYYTSLEEKVKPEVSKVKSEEVPAPKKRKVEGEDDQDEVISKQLNPDNTNYQKKFICSLKLLKKYEKEIFAKYANIKNIDVKLAKKMLAIKILRMLAFRHDIDLEKD